MNHLPTGEIAIGAPNSDVREAQLDQIAKNMAIQYLRLPDGHTYGKDSIAAKFVEAFIEGAKWQRNPLTYAP